MKKVLSIIVVSLLLGTLLLGCNSANKKVNMYKEQSQVNTVKSNQEMVSRILEMKFVETGKIPSDVEIEESLSKTLEEMNISIIRNTDGSIAISNTNTELTKEDVPDLIIPKEELTF